jgi:hypothetical protein
VERYAGGGLDRCTEEEGGLETACWGESYRERDGRMALSVGRFAGLLPE